MRKKKEDTNGEQVKAHAKAQSRSKSVKPASSGQKMTKKDVKITGETRKPKKASPTTKSKKATKVKRTKPKTSKSSKQDVAKKVDIRPKRKPDKAARKTKQKNKPTKKIVARLANVKVKKVDKKSRAKGKTTQTMSVIARRILESKRIKPSKRFSEPLEYVCKRCKQSVELYIPARVTCSRCGKPMQINTEVETNVEPLAKAA